MMFQSHTGVIKEPN